MPEAIDPIISAIGEFFYHADYPNKFQTDYPDKDNHAIAVLPCEDRFNITHAIESWLQREPGSTIFEPVNIKNADPAGLILMRDDSATIRYSVEKNTCHKRLVIVKELCHLIVRVLEYENYIDVPNLLLAVSRRDGVYGCYDSNTQAGQQEILSHLLSEQILVPWFENDKIMQSTLSNYDLALDYRVPEFIIEYRKTRTSPDPFEEQIKTAYEERLEQVKANTHKKAPQ